MVNRSRFRADGQYEDAAMPLKRRTVSTTSNNGQATRSDRRSERSTGRANVLDAKARLAHAKASKRKWLFMLLLAGAALYFAFTSGGGITTLLKGLRP
tara:strand:+ start:157 stop:450 length:294 start_codon:yes stop_codon:yes gene_type:complete